MDQFSLQHGKNVIRRSGVILLPQGDVGRSAHSSRDDIVAFVDEEPEQPGPRRPDFRSYPELIPRCQECGLHDIFGLGTPYLSPGNDDQNGTVIAYENRKFGLTRIITGEELHDFLPPLGYQGDDCIGLFRNSQ